jgi:hypothetical protein
MEMNDGWSEFHYRDVASFLFPDLLGRGGTNVAGKHNLEIQGRFGALSSF